MLPWIGDGMPREAASRLSRVRYAPRTTLRPRRTRSRSAAPTMASSRSRASRRYAWMVPCTMGRSPSPAPAASPLNASAPANVK
uniref:Uncharacterized protein n=1 Tax=Arundo donax TaxID=35708 RepID=A0A0A9GP34_ARUDO